MTKRGSKTRILAKKFVELMDIGVGEYYEEIHGKYWKEQKEEELLDEPLVHIYYVNSSSEDQSEIESLAAYVSVQYSDLLFDDDYREYHQNPKKEDNSREKVAYLYEIHIDKPYQNKGLGTRLLQTFHQMTDAVNKIKPMCVASELTVFNKNKTALRWYLKSGYYVYEEEGRSVPRISMLRRWLKRSED